MDQTADDSRPTGGLAFGKRVLQFASALAILLAVAVTIAVALADRRAAIEDAEERTRHSAALIAAEIGGIISVVDVIFARAIELAGPGDQPIASSREVWEQMVDLGRSAPFLESLWFGGPDGGAILSTHQFPAPPLSAADRDYFTAQRDKDPGLYLGIVQRDRYTSSRSLVFSRRLERP